MTWKCDGHDGAVHTASPHHAVAVAVPRKAAGDVRAYERVETEPGLDKFVDDVDGDLARHGRPCSMYCVYDIAA